MLHEQANSSIWPLPLSSNPLQHSPSEVAKGAQSGSAQSTSPSRSIAFVAGHVYAAYVQGVSYLRHYLEPHPFLLPFNIIGELSRTLALSLRLFGNMLSGHLILAILVYLVGFLLPVPLMLLSVLTGVVQAYIFGVLTLVFAVSSVTVARRGEADSPGPSSGKGYERGASG